MKKIGNDHHFYFHNIERIWHDFISDLYIHDNGLPFGFKKDHEHKLPDYVKIKGNL